LPGRILIGKRVRKSHFTHFTKGINLADGRCAQPCVRD